MKLVVGLGNPGKQYINTRHNIGFMIIDKMANDFKLVKKYNSLISKQNNIIYLKPQTFMNNSGQAVAAIANYYKIKPENIFVIYDDKDLPFTSIRLRPSGSAGGHNGIKSIIQYLGTKDFNRIRIGINNPAYKIKDTADYVLCDFSTTEKKQLSKIKKIAMQAIETAMSQNIETAMNKYN